MTDLRKLDLKLLLWAFLACTGEPILHFINNGYMGKQGIVLILAVATMALFSLEKRGAEGAGWIMTLCVIVACLSGSFTGLVVASAFTILEVTWATHVVFEIIFIILIVQPMRLILRMREKYESLEMRNAQEEGQSLYE